MKKKFLVMLCVMMASVGASARFYESPKAVQRYEGGAFAGVNIPMNTNSDYDSRSGIDLGAEFRVNLKNSPFDVGVIMMLRGMDYRYKWIDYDSSRGIFALSVCGDFNFRQGYKVNPFVGAGAGVAINGNNNNNDVYKGPSTLILFRAGVELWYHVRLTADMSFTVKGFSCAGLTVGFSLGGRPRKQITE
ncbi:MAG: hypothetical protein K2M79_00340 [Muribaculaceae bacterium]|nr:hypothetical protein [Muribaculaceae bacterium]